MREAFRTYQGGKVEPRDRASGIEIAGSILEEERAIQSPNSLPRLPDSSAWDTGVLSPHILAERGLAQVLDEGSGDAVMLVSVVRSSEKDNNNKKDEEKSFPS